VEDAERGHFGAFVRQERELRGWTLAELGRRIGRGERRVWGLEQLSRAPARRTTLAKLAQAFDMSPEQFEAGWRAATESQTPIYVHPKTYAELAERAARHHMGIPEVIQAMLIADQILAQSSIGKPGASPEGGGTGNPGTHATPRSKRQRSKKS
jgi:transcriptional regulator with XRE-family HTH domain